MYGHGVIVTRKRTAVVVGVLLLLLVGGISAWVLYRQRTGSVGYQLNKLKGEVQIKLRLGERIHKLHFLDGMIYLPTSGSRGAYRIGALLVRANKLSGRDLLRALELQKTERRRERLGDLLVRHKLVTQNDLDEVPTEYRPRQPGLRR